MSNLTCPDPRLRKLTKRRTVSFWGRDYRVTPRLVSALLGDGQQLIWFEPMDTRPWYYILRVDSKWSVKNWDEDPVCDHLDEICEAIEAECGQHRETYDHDNGRTYTKHNPWPALNMETGCAQWGKFEE